MKSLQVFALCIFTTSSLIQAEPSASASVINNITNQNHINIVGLEALIEKFGAQFGNAQKRYADIIDYFKVNKYTIGGTSILTAYVLVAKKLSAGKVILNHKNSWSNWKSDIDLASLLQEKHSTLCKELHQSIVDKYQNNDQSDLLTPVVLFSNDVETELTTLKMFCKICDVLEKVKLRKIFLIQTVETINAQNKINRLNHLKNTFTELIRVSL